MPDETLHLSDVRKSYAGRVILDTIDLSVATGTLVALVGPSGSGKTTLLKAINRLIEIDAGTIVWGGDDIRNLPVTDLRRRIGYAFQGVGLFPHLTVAENIAIVPRLLGASPAERAARVEELLRLVALPADFSNRAPRSLSGGQAQRVGLARALAARPRLMLLDEPFGALDPVTRDELGRAYRALHDSLGLTTIMVTHDMAEALLLADRILVLIDGRIRADGTPTDLLRADQPDAIRALIDVPRSQAARLAALANA